MRTVIKSISASAPANRVSNDDLAKIVDTSDEWIYSHTGIKYRHLADPGTAASDLALDPCRDALEKAGVSPEELDMIIVASTTPDHPGFPSTACILQDKLKATNAGAFDITAACSGFIYSLEIAKNFIKGGSAQKLLVVGVEILSAITDWKDRGTCVLLGDGAGAAVVCAEEGEGVSDICASSLHADGSGSSFLIRQAGGSRHPITPDKPMEYDSYMKMDGQKVYHFAVKALGDTIKALLEKESLSIEEIKYVVPHQANARIIKAASKRTKIPLEKFYMNLEEYGNTSAASIPLALHEMNEKKLLTRGDYILLVGFGGGLTYGGNLIRW